MALRIACQKLASSIGLYSSLQEALVSLMSGSSPICGTLHTNTRSEAFQDLMSHSTQDQVAPLTLAV